LQTTDNQLLDLQKVANLSGWEIVEIYQDHGISGSKGRDKRPAFDQMLRDATARRFDVIMAWSLDRLSRSLQDLVTFLNEVRDPAPRPLLRVAAIAGGVLLCDLDERLPASVW
jgi:DNA invertase Pin-like site-specific DNA recombinase